MDHTTNSEKRNTNREKFDSGNPNVSGYFSQMPVEAAKAKWLTGTEHKLLSVLESYADSEGVAWPTNETLQHDLGMGRTAVQRAFRGLKSKGVIKVTTFRGRRNGSVVHREELISFTYKLRGPDASVKSTTRGSPFGAHASVKSTTRGSDFGAPLSEPNLDSSSESNRTPQTLPRSAGAPGVHAAKTVVVPPTATPSATQGKGQSPPTAWAAGHPPVRGGGNGSVGDCKTATPTYPSEPYIPITPEMSDEEAWDAEEVNRRYVEFIEEHGIDHADEFIPF